MNTRFKLLKSDAGFKYLFDLRELSTVTPFMTKCPHCHKETDDFHHPMKCSGSGAYRIARHDDTADGVIPLINSERYAREVSAKQGNLLNSGLKPDIEV